MELKDLIEVAKSASAGDDVAWDCFQDNFGPQEFLNMVKQNKALVEALHEMTNDITERFDMDSKSTNPGIKSCVENARAALALAGAA